MWGSPELKKLILNREGDGVNPGQLVVRPDSGVPKDVSRVHAWSLSERTLCVRAFLPRRQSRHAPHRIVDRLIWRSWKSWASPSANRRTRRVTGSWIPTFGSFKATGSNMKLWLKSSNTSRCENIIIFCSGFCRDSKLDLGPARKSVALLCCDCAHLAHSNTDGRPETLLSEAAADCCKRCARALDLATDAHPICPLFALTSCSGPAVCQMDRDTQKCAFKCSHLTFKDGTTRDVYKVIASRDMGISLACASKAICFCAPYFYAPMNELMDG